MTRPEFQDCPDMVELGLIAAANPSSFARIFGSVTSPVPTSSLQDTCFPESR